MDQVLEAPRTGAGMLWKALWALILALAASRSVLVKGAHPANALTYAIASTNLVIELGIVLLVLLTWHSLVGNLLMSVFMIIYATC